ncbi:MAG: hypothetical protein WCP97_07835 [bacterium]
MTFEKPNPVIERIRETSAQIRDVVVARLTHVWHVGRRTFEKVTPVAPWKSMINTRLRQNNDQTLLQNLLKEQLPSRTEVEHKNQDNLTPASIYERNKNVQSKIHQAVDSSLVQINGNELIDITHAIQQQENGLHGVVPEAQWGHGMTRIPPNKEELIHRYGLAVDASNDQVMIAALYSILKGEGEEFKGDFGPIERSQNAETNQYAKCWETGHFIIVRTTNEFYKQSSSWQQKLNTEGIQVVVNLSMNAYGKDLARSFPDIPFIDFSGQRIT